MLNVIVSLDLSKLHNVIQILPEVGTNNITSKAQQSFQPVKAQHKWPNSIFLISEVKRNFRNELFDSVEAQCNSAIVETHFRTMLKCNLTSAIEISQHDANRLLYCIFCNFRQKKSKQFVKEGRHQYFD